MKARLGGMAIAIWLAYGSICGMPKVALAGDRPLPTPVDGSRSPRIPRPGGGGWLQKLNLTPDQLQKIKAIRAQNEGVINQRVQDLRQSRQKLRDLLAGQGSESDIATQHQVVRQQSQEVEDLRLQNLLAIREILTPDQRQQLMDLVDQTGQALRDSLPKKNQSNN